MPVGAILDFAGPNAPTGWLICDGRTVSRTTYSALFAVIGTYWGAGDGTSTFALPSPNGRASIGPGTVIDANGASYSYSFTQKAGVVTNVIAKVNLPNYNMTSDTQGSHSHGGATVTASHSHTMDLQGNHSHGGLTDLNGNHTHDGTTNFTGDHFHAFVALQPAGPAIGGGSGNAFQGQTTNTGVAGNHQHSYTTNIAGSHNHGISLDGNHTHTIFGGDHAHVINQDGSHTHTINLGGSGTPFGVLQPVLVVTKIIYAGNQAAVTVMGEIVPAAMASELAITDELATLRTELAELRAILMPPRGSRVMSAPSRGPH